MRALPALLAACLASSAAHALTPVAQDRHVFVSHDFTPDGGEGSELLSAPSFAPFSAGVDGVAGPPTSPVSFSYLSSTIEVERLQAIGYTVAYPKSLPGLGHDVVSNAVYSVDFVLDEARGFTLSG